MMMFLVFINLFLLLNGFPQQLTERQYRNIGYNMRPLMVPQGLIPFLDSEAMEVEPRERRNPDHSEDGETNQFLPQHDHNHAFHYDSMDMKSFVDFGNQDKSYRKETGEPAKQEQFARLVKKPAPEAKPKEDDKEE